MRSIGITGGIGSGKTIVCRVLEALGYPVFYADQAAKACMNEDMILRQEIIALLGQESYLRGEVNRPFIAEKIFASAELRTALNALVHPAVFRAFEYWKKQQDAALIFNESALLFETGSYKRFDAIFLVTADPEVRIQRVMQRDDVSREQVIARMENQWTDAQKEPLCTSVIKNDPDILVVPQILREVGKLLETAE